MKIVLTEEQVKYGMAVGAERSRIMAAKADKQGYSKQATGGMHRNDLNDGLGVLAEMAVCIAVGADYTNPNHWVGAVALDEDGNLPECTRQPDVMGIYEVRRSEDGRLPIKMYQKDYDAKAYVIQAEVVHECDRAEGLVVPSGVVHLIGWVDVAEVFNKPSTTILGDVRTRATKMDMDDLPLICQECASIHD